MKRLILIIMALILSSCATQSRDELLKGELFSSTVMLENEKEFEQKIRIKDDEIYSFTISFK
jgi:hypothetical protein